MNHEQIQRVADIHGFGFVYFQFNIAENTGKSFEVGYITRNNKRVLFCKRGSNTNPDQFYLCNEFSKLV